MAVLRFLATAAACAATAVGIGQFMERGISRASATPVDLPDAYAVSPVLIGAPTDSAPQTALTFDAPMPPRNPARLAGLAGAPDSSGCGLDFTATPRPGAIAALRIDAPCAPSARVTLRHQGLSVTLLTDTSGRAEMLFPALAETAVFMAETPGATATASTVLPDMDQWRRVALQWRDGAEMSLHAITPGARYDSPEHLSRLNPRTGMEGPTMMSIGDPTAPAARLAEIYSAPAGDTAEISIEIEVTARNCGRPVAAELVGANAVHGLYSTDFDVTLPGCDAKGELLVLQNLEPGPTVAAR